MSVFCGKTSNGRRWIKKILTLHLLLLFIATYIFACLGCSYNVQIVNIGNQRVGVQEEEVVWT